MDLESTRPTTEGAQLRNDIIVLAQHSRSMIIGMLQYQIRIRSNIDKQRQDGTLAAPDLNTLEGRWMQMVSDIWDVEQSQGTHAQHLGLIFKVARTPGATLEHTKGTIWDERTTRR